MEGEHQGIPYRVEPDRYGTFMATWMCPKQIGASTSYWALAGQGYRFATAEQATLACRETIEKYTAERDTPPLVTALHALTGMGIEGPGGIYKPDAMPAPEGEKCVRCGRPGMWIAGAGLTLCHQHQNDY